MDRDYGLSQYQEQAEQIDFQLSTKLQLNEYFDELTLVWSILHCPSSIFFTLFCCNRMKLEFNLLGFPLPFIE